MGIFIGYWGFAAQRSTDKEGQENVASLNREASLAQNDNVQSTATQQQTRIHQLLKKIKRLENKLEDLTHRVSSTTAVQEPPKQQNSKMLAVKSDKNLTKMNIEDFNNMMQESIVSRSRSIILQFDDKRIAELKEDFDKLQFSDEWSINYQDKMSQFITENDSSGDLFINTINCRTSICRLEVNTSNLQFWEALYLNMSQQSWFQSITIQENTDYPDTIIYYLIKQEN
ncbi:MAG: hypothetical protein Q9M92_00785 [Enterobacterales bacterium]|nr:hypothetical protein [Enterobacterales bacterium]